MTKVTLAKLEIGTEILVIPGDDGAMYSTVGESAKLRRTAIIATYQGGMSTSEGSLTPSRSNTKFEIA